LRILLVTDAWAPQVNGVVVSLRNTIACLEKLGHEVRVISPEGFRTVPMPSYPEIPLAVLPGRKVARLMRDYAPDAVHIATEGPLGVAARAYCLRSGWAFTTAYHTCFPEYIKARSGLPLAWTYALMKWFHGPSAAVMVGTTAIRTLLVEHGFRKVVDWSKGVDTQLFHPAHRDASQYQRPVFLFVGRVAVEKNIAAFLQLELPGTKVVVGDGPQRAELQRRFKDAVFVGVKSGHELASYFQAADVFVFPSLTDTFGLVLIEALACGTPVAAFPVRGPIDVIKDPAVGVLDSDLRAAALKALTLDRAAARRYAESYSWERCTQQFLEHLAPVHIPTITRTALESTTSHAG
jgi:glycosyltransferase involved in cell wall biosynthesis